ncbi:ATP-binding protein [Streptosporangium sp. NPDC001681]|uniref:sensor histidine kinase n=1 Tax=Streptosporangium sp. NPDC001681 TaxID=3154395 RepID=UPI0033303D9C
MTLTALVLFMLVLGIGMFAIQDVVRDKVLTDATDAVAEAAGKAVQSVENGPANAVVLPTSHISLIQVVAADGRVVAASPAMKGKPRISETLPTDGDLQVNGTSCMTFPTGRQTCYIIVGFRIDHSPYGKVMVYAAAPEPQLLRTNVLEISLALFGSVLLALLGWGTWQLAGRTLKPVARIRAKMAEITATDLSRRMPVPDSEDEVAQLTKTVNATLERLERAVENQRRFASDASHELRTPLTGLRTKLELAISDPNAEDSHTTMRAVLADAERLQAIIDDLLLLTRLDAGVQSTSEQINLSELVTAEVERWPHRHEVLLKLAPDVVVRGNRLQLTRLLTNLLTNADRHATKEIQVRVGNERGEAVMEVIDDGLGIPAGEHERIFQRFTRLDSARSRDAGGTGLGLPIARDIALAHQGRLYATDRATGNGARIVLCLPLSTATRR